MDLKSFFESEGIFYTALLPMDRVRVTNEALLARTIPSARSVLLFLVPYYAGDLPGNLSLYARSKDYHLFAKELSTRLYARLKKLYPGKTFHLFTDHSPLSEVYAAALGGLGVLGDNGLLINERYGSYVFLFDLLSDMTLPEWGFESTIGSVSGCLHCGACKRACPCRFEDCASGVGQKKGALSPEEEALVLKTGLVWGCDLCQRACPLNKNAEKTAIPFFYEDRIERLDTETLSSLQGERFKERAFAWRGRATVARNVALFERTEEASSAPNGKEEI